MMLPGSAVPEMLSEDVPFCAGTVVVMTGAAGGVVSMTAVTGLVATVFPAESVATAVKVCAPSANGPGVKCQEPDPSTVAGPRLVGPSRTSTETTSALTEPD